MRGRRDRPRPGSRRAGGSGCPLSPSSAPSRRHLLPSHRRVLRARVRNVTGGSRREGTDPGGGTGTRLPPPSVAGGRGGGQGGEGRGKGRGGSRAGPGPGEQGPGAPATRAPPLPPRRCAQAGAPARRPLVADSASPGPPGGSQFHLPRCDTPPPPRSPLLPGARSPKVPGTGAPTLGARPWDPRPPRGSRGRRGGRHASGPPVYIPLGSPTLQCTTPSPTPFSIRGVTPSYARERGSFELQGRGEWG